MKRLIRIFLVFSLIVPSLSFAAIEAYEFENEQMEAEYNELIKELRCLVCQNQNLAGSDAELAQDLRRQTHEMLMQGSRPEQIIQYMADRYGDFVLYRPQFKSSTFLLWAGPFILVVIVLWLVVRKIRAREALVEPDDESIKRARELLASKQDNS